MANHKNENYTSNEKKIVVPGDDQATSLHTQQMNYEEAMTTEEDSMKEPVQHHNSEWESQGN